MLEIMGLPLRITETDVRKWLEKQIGGELVTEIKHCGLMTDVECKSIRASRSTGMLIKSAESPLSLNCYLGLDSFDALQQV